jgi:hypothetical protein
MKKVKVTRTFDNIEDFGIDANGVWAKNDEEVCCLNNLRITVIFEGDQEEDEE